MNHKLNYEPPAARQSHSVWTWVGLGVAACSALEAAAIWTAYWRSSQGGRIAHYEVSALGLAIPVTAAMLCVVGALRGAKRWAVMGIVLSGLAWICLVGIRFV